MLTTTPKNRFFAPLLMACGVLLTACNQGTQAATPAQAEPNANAGDAQQVAKNLQDNLRKVGIEERVINAQATEMPGVYRVNLQSLPPVYTDKSGTYVLQGSLISLAGDTAVNLSDKAAAELAKATLATINLDDAIVFSPRGDTKAALYVFTDPTCPYCQLLHKDTDKINDLGVEVRYLAWPRNEQAFAIAQAVWCSPDRKKAFTDAKQGKLPNPLLCPNPINDHMELGLQLGVTGTPAIFTESGEQIGGYLPPEELASLATKARNTKP